jgi:dTDP-L-rhamnose 4-epimerase
VIYASSRAVYGEGKYQCPEHGIVYPAGRSPKDLEHGRFEPTCPVCHAPCVPLATDEDTPGRPISIYGLTKLAQEMMISLAAKSLGFKACGLRYQNVYGPGQSLKNPYTGILSIFSSLAKRGEEINIFEDGRESRDFVYIEDVIDATVRCLTLDILEAEILNVGSGKSISVLEVAGLINDYYGKRSKLKVSGEFRLGDIRHNFADLSRVSTRLGFQPTWGFKDGLKLFLDWADRQESNVGDYQRSLEEMKSRGLMGKSA